MDAFFRGSEGLPGRMPSAGKKFLWSGVQSITKNINFARIILSHFMKFVGADVSIYGGLENAPVNAHIVGAKTFALFTKNQRQWTAKPLSQENIEK